MRNYGHNTEYYWDLERLLNNMDNKGGWSSTFRIGLKREENIDVREV